MVTERDLMALADESIADPDDLDRLALLVAEDPALFARLAELVDARQATEEPGSGGDAALERCLAKIDQLGLNHRQEGRPSPASVASGEARLRISGWWSGTAAGLAAGLLIASCGWFVYDSVSSRRELREVNRRYAECQDQMARLAQMLNKEGTVVAAMTDRERNLPDPSTLPVFRAAHDRYFGKKLIPRT